MVEIRKKAFEEWFGKYGVTSASQGKYKLALADTRKVLDYYDHNPYAGGSQKIDKDVYPKSTIYELVDPQPLRELFNDCTKQNVRDDGAMHTAVGWYALWLRLIDPKRWKGIAFWPEDDTRKKTMKNKGYDYDAKLSHREKTYAVDKYLAAIRTKPFILLAGISGTGKSRMVRQLARGCCPADSPLAKDSEGKEAKKPGNFEMIPVRPNWHDSTELMGYVTRITSDKQPRFVLTPFVQFLVKAWQNLDVPFFLCLDEMNLAPVEQYFAEYLSAIESRDWVDADDHSKGKTTDVMVHFDVAQIKKDELHPYDDETKNFVEQTVKELLPGFIAAEESSEVKKLGNQIVADGGLRIPPNLVVMGTVNMDETTCSFSRKVLDRAMTFELNDVSDMYDISNIAGEGPYDFGSIAPEAIWQTLLSGKDACDSAEGKAEIDAATHKTVAQVVLEYIKTINDVLENTPFKIAYRSRNEILIYCLERTRGAIVGLPQALDEATSMKILSRIEGDEQKLTYLEGNGAEPSKTLLDVLAKKIPEALKTANGGHDPTPPCEVCGKKIEFMARRLKGGFTNFFV